MQSEKRSWLWVPTAYFAEGGPYMVVSLVSAILFKSLGMENDDIALWTGLMMLPWSIKPLWAPFIDLFRTKRQWILATQLLMALLFAGMAALIVRESLSAVLIGFFFLLAFASATHDVAVDGFYLIALDKHTQALLAGIRGTFYRIASVSVQGGLVMLAGLIEKDYKQTILLQDAKMKHLQAQINPHFLYNSFYLLSHLVKMEDQEAAEKLSRYLGDYFRYIRVCSATVPKSSNSG